MIAEECTAVPGLIKCLELLAGSDYCSEIMLSVML